MREQQASRVEPSLAERSCHFSPLACAASACCVSARSTVAHLLLALCQISAQLRLLGQKRARRRRLRHWRPRRNIVFSFAATLLPSQQLLCSAEKSRSKVSKSVALVCHVRRRAILSPDKLCRERAADVTKSADPDLSIGGTDRSDSKREFWFHLATTIGTSNGFLSAASAI